MNGKTALICTILSLSVLSIWFFNQNKGESSQSTEKPHPAVQREALKPAFGNPNPTDVQTKQQITNQPKKINSEAQLNLASDSSEITTSYDAYGTKTEMRGFKVNPYLSMVIVKTLADKTKAGFAVAHNNSTRLIPAYLYCKCND